MFGTLQNRLPKELALNNITTMDEANTYLKEIYLPRHNQQFSVSAKSTQPAFIDWNGGDLNDILCIQDDRVVNKDNTVQYHGTILQIPPNDYKNHFVKAHVEARAYLNGTLGIFYGHYCIGKYDLSGVLIDQSSLSLPQIA